MAKETIKKVDNDAVENMDRDKYNRLVADRIKKAFDQSQMSQDDLIEQCKLFGYSPKQCNISKLLNDQEKFDPYKLSIICKILDLNLDEVLSFDPDDVNIAKHDVGFVTDATDDRFKGFIGQSYGYFLSTEDKQTVHGGEFVFSVNQFTKRCNVTFSFKTGQKDANRRNVIKIFSGTARFSYKLAAICCELTAEDGSGDVSYIIFKHMFTNNQECMCRLGMVVTICAGEKRLPTSQRVLISRKKLTKADYPFIIGQLKLNDNTFIISESNYKKFKQDPNLPSSISASIHGKKDILLSKAKRQVYYSFLEDDISNLNLEDADKIIALLRLYSESKLCKKIGQKGEKYTFSYIKSKTASKKNKTKKN